MSTTDWGEHVSDIVAWAMVAVGGVIAFFGSALGEQVLRLTLAGVTVGTGAIRVMELRGRRKQSRREELEKRLQSFWHLVTWREGVRAQGNTLSEEALREIGTSLEECRRFFPHEFRGTK